MHNSSNGNINGSKQPQRSPVDRKLFQACYYEQASSDEIKAYFESLLDFVRDGHNITHPEHHTANKQLQQLQDIYERLPDDDRDETRSEREQTRPDNNGTRPKKEKVIFTAEEVAAKIDRLIEGNHPQSKLQFLVNQLADELGYSSFVFWQMFGSRQKELEEQSFHVEVKEELDRTLSLQEASINLADFLPGPIAKPMMQMAGYLAARPGVCLTALLAATSSCIPIGTKVWLNRSQNFKEYPYLYCAIVAETGQKKSPIFNSFAREPLEILQFREKEQHSKLVQDYLEQLHKWNSLIKDDREEEFPEGKPTEPPPEKIWFIDQYTPEGLMQRYQAYPRKALLYSRDELKGLFGDFDRYSKGKSERQEFLSYFNCKGSTTIRVSGVKANIKQTGLSVLGTIQPQVLQELWGGGNDADGLWGRFIYATQPRVPGKFAPEGTQYILDDLLAGLFDKIGRVSPVEYELSRHARKLYEAYYNHLEEISCRSIHPGMTSVYAKAEGITGRLALNLHVLDEILDSDREEPFIEISGEIMQKAIDLMNFYISQVQLLYEQASRRNELYGHLLKIIKFAQKEQWIDARSLKRYVREFRNTDPNIIRGWFQDLEKLKYGVTKGKAKRLKFRLLKTSTIQN